VDLVAVLSPWPETFSFVLHEALAAGADVVALEDGGNVAAAVRRHGRGVVLRDGAAFLRFFEEGWALDYVRQLAAVPRQGARLVLTGTSATLDPGALAPVPLAALETDDPALVLVLGDGRVVGPEPGGAWRFALPVGAGSAWLASRHALPLPGKAVRGVKVAGLALDGVAVALDDPRLGEGWHAPQDGMRWTAGAALVRLDGARRLEVRLSAGERWRRVPLAAG
jgi:hypothetical protein